MSVWCCIATGPSLTVTDVEAVRGRCNVIAINDSYRLAPWADVLYAADLAWWHIHFEHAKPDFEGKMWTVEAKGRNAQVGHDLYGLKIFKQESGDGLSRTPGVLRVGGFSGYQGINAAYLWDFDLPGKTVILLLGYDMQTTGGMKHWFGDHPAGLLNGDFAKRIPNLATIKPADYGIEVVNCSRQTAVKCFPRMTIEEALERYAPV